MSRKFENLTAIAAPLPLANVDTDKILAGEFLKTITRTGLGTKLFFAMRYDESGKERADFVLNQEPWRKAGILIALDNFGCGSSREHAPWALADFGIRCIIAPSFADIFYGNCFKNGILPVVLPHTDVEALLSDARDPDTALMHVDLPTQQVRRANGHVISFEISAEHKIALLQGRDEISASLEHEDRIVAWEKASSIISPAIGLDIKHPPVRLS